MNHSKLYVPDPNVWIHFFKRTSEKNKINQKGGNSSIRSAGQSKEPLNVESVSPVEAADERTQSAIKRLRKETGSTRRSKGKSINVRTKSKLSREKKVVKSSRRETVTRKTKTRRRKSVTDIFSNKESISVLNGKSFHEGIPSQLELFDLRPTQTVVQDAYFADLCHRYRAMIQTLLNFGEGAETSQLTTMLFIKDSNETMADCNTDGSNDALVERKAYIALSQLLDLQGGLYHDFFQMKRYLLNQVDVKVKLYQTTQAFCLLSATSGVDFKIDITDVCLLAWKVRVNPAVIFAHSETLNTKNAFYPFVRTDCCQQSIPLGSSSFH